MRKIIVLLALLVGMTEAHAQATAELCIRATPTGFCQAVNSTTPLPVASSGAGGSVSTINPQADGQSNAVTGAAASSFGYVYNGVTWDRVRSSQSMSDGGVAFGAQAGSNMVFNGVGYDREFACTNSAIVNVPTASTTQIVALTSGQTIRVCSFVITGSAIATVATFVYGTGASCVTGLTPITGAMKIAADNNIALSAGGGSLFRTASANALCLTASTGDVTGFVTYAKF